MLDPRSQKRTSRLSAAISLALHSIVIGLLVFLAAREGMLGKELKKIAVTIVPKEKPPEKPKEPPKEKPVEKAPEEKRAPETAKTPEQKPQVADNEPKRTVNAPPPADSLAGGAAAPPPADVPSFEFGGGKVVETTTDPTALYKSYVEFTLRSRWTRPEGVADDSFVAEVEVELDRAGNMSGSRWLRGSGHQAWDDSVRKALASAPVLGKAPPREFPAKVLVRFDVQPVSDVELQ